MAWGSNTNIANEWARRLSANDPTFVSLHILSFRRVTPAEFSTLFVALAHNSTLRELYCSGHKLDAAAVQSLADALKTNTTLTSINVGNAEFGTDEEGSLFEIFCGGLAENAGVTKLDLENKGLMQSARVLAGSLGKHRYLTEINLSRNNLEDEAVRIMCQGIAANATAETPSPLRKLNLSMNSIHQNGAEAIAQLLTDPNIAIAELDLSENPLTVVGATAVGTALASNTSVMSLKLSGITAELENLDLDASESHSSTDRPTAGDLALAALAGSLRTNTTLQSLHMIANDIGPLGIQPLTIALTSNNTLAELRLRQNKIGDHGASTLAKALSRYANRTLRWLDLAENGITGVGFKHLLQCEGLEYLSLFNNRINSYEAVMRPLSASSNELRTLDLGCNGITTADFAILCKALARGFAPRLKTLEIGGNVRNEEEEHRKWANLEEGLVENRQGLDIAWKRVGMDINR